MKCIVLAGGQTLAAFPEKLSEAVYLVGWQSFDFSGYDCQKYGIL